MKKYILFILLFCSCILVSAQEQKKQLKLITTDYTTHNENEIPGAVILTGNVQFEHDGANIYGNKVYFFQKEQYIKVFGNVRLIQGDSVTIVGNYGEYNGKDRLAFIADQVNLRSKESTLATDTLFYNRNTEQAFYNNNGTIISGENTLKSKNGTYDVPTKKFIFRTNVDVKNPTTTINTNHLDYYENSGHAYVFGPSWITQSNGDRLYTENGFYDTKNDLGTIGKNGKIFLETQTIEADKLFYDKKKNFARAENNIKITDTINNMVATGHYAEVFKDVDSMFITKKALLKNVVENDTLYLHGKKIVVTGPEGERVARAFNNVRIYKSDLSGKSDSIYSNQKTGITKMIKDPVIWSQGSQITGDIIYLLSDENKEQMDSIKVLNNAFIIQKDTLGTGYNQMKGIDLFGKFKDNKLSIVDLIKNTESIYYMYDDSNELVGIEKAICSKIRLEIENNEIQNVIRYINPDSEIYPEADLPVNARLLKGFKWRGDEEIKSLEDIFPPEELAEDDKAILIKQTIDELELEPMEVLPETLQQNEPQNKKPNNLTKKKGK
ncbi:OstA-like protein [Flavobacterium agricola]|uniref:OstA-like protein n=1 Tax=Flavobacterium agricola TaxID=2870839 RepID=A0ABY6LZ18_9FLAO|nr:OstA-like protein [Flavobacterium agricola]UYW00400.1 OstA-like protein [Flavobacterium agricola]